MKINVLDHGFVRLVETWGKGDAGVPEAGIIEAARQSTQGAFRSWAPYKMCEACGAWTLDITGVYDDPCFKNVGVHEWKTYPRGDVGLLSFLFNNKPPHATPFEFAGLVLEVKAPIFVFREWHRHRTQCLAGDTKLYFDLPGGVERRGTQKYVLTIRDVVSRFQPTVRTDRAERQTNAFWPRERMQAMQLRCVDEETLAVTHTTIVDAWESGVKTVFRVEIETGETIRCSADHRFFTASGWRRLRDLVPMTGSPNWGGDDFTDGPTVYSVFGAPNEAADFEVLANEAEEKWRQVLGWEEFYEVSNMGRVRRISPAQGARLDRCKKLSADRAGYMCVSLNRPGVQERPHVHKLVLEAFVGPAPGGYECCHFDGNSMNNWLTNLRWGTPQDNADDRVRHGRVPSLKTFSRHIVRVMPEGEEMTYDIEVADPWHNFVADGFVVHNSYNEMSARYAPLPNENYIPTVERLMRNAGGTNKQAGTVKDAVEMTEDAAHWFRGHLERIYDSDEVLYKEALSRGVPKELARVHLPVGRYSQMRASTCLRNWLGFLTLRADKGAQFEIQEYARAVGQIIQEQMPRTWELFDLGRAA